MSSVIPRADAFRAARAVLDAARARRDALPVRVAAQQAADGSTLSADEIEALLLDLRARTVDAAPALPAAA
ncbi:hypothetical protein [Embleya sp. MST-111070]|uniref:hypothetical protein n=1 Tax=Embleya sp. MST-111070 TaxID=3398231 RepID=UPI003F739478